jgi:hypothetical protein
MASSVSGHQANPVYSDVFAPKNIDERSTLGDLSRCLDSGHLRRYLLLHAKEIELSGLLQLDSDKVHLNPYHFNAQGKAAKTGHCNGL